MTTTADPMSDNEALRLVLALATARVWTAEDGQWTDAETRNFEDAVNHVRMRLTDHGDRLHLSPPSAEDAEDDHEHTFQEDAEHILVCDHCGLEGPA